MLNGLILNNFKLFKDNTAVPLAKLNLLTGVNGRGKSTVLQSLLLFMQSVQYDRTSEDIHFNGSCVNLGFFEDVKNIQNSKSIPITVGFLFSSTDLEYEIIYTIVNNSEDHLIGTILNVEIKGNFKNQFFEYLIDNREDKIIIDSLNGKIKEVLSFYDLFIPNQFQDEILVNIYNTLSYLKVHYVSADRIGPKLYYNSVSKGKFNSTGPNGENTVSTLFNNRNKIVDGIFLDHINAFYNVLTEELDKTVEGQTNFWLGKIFYGAKYEIKEVVETNLLKFQISTDGNFDFHKPTNVGYGFSYVLPIIVSGLIATAGEILIVENPEAHLHPYAQSVISKFLTLVSLKGVQVIVESHSDHILNGFRIPVFECIIKKEDLNILYFDKIDDSQFSIIEIDDNGGIRNWPKDFFDQSTKDFNHLLGL